METQSQIGGMIGVKRPRVLELVLYISVAVLSVISLSLIASIQDFQTVAAASYLVACTVLPFLYTVVQVVFVSCSLGGCGPSCIASGFYIRFSCIADLVACFFLISGASAVLGFVTAVNNGGSGIAQATAGACLALLAFIAMVALATLSVFRSLL
ncbi:hypothetical protein KP509_11G050000 [Ceratopteris richardii]|uniref:CASP-like protein n=1 Tax=Ceratopteris richardii TaxID=49495 RepID=A0A8T2TXX4_CERRI|nr:hypothetical protein KP509_11G050000 [Ceratopteris richardii]KAH7425339.1 hypothetical protein KP509_11G050000 [Ceratopteris richardii]